LLAGVIGAAANAGYLLVGVISIMLGTLRSEFAALGLPESWVQWRLLMVCGALPALLTFFIRMFVPESHKWEKEKARWATSAWASTDLLTVLLGVAICAGMLGVWHFSTNWPLRIAATLAALVMVGCCYLYPIVGYLNRSGESNEVRSWILKRMLLAALISGIPLLAT